MAFVQQNGELGIASEGRFVSLGSWLKGRHRPVYFYDLDDILLRVQAYRRVFKRPVSLHYALKANANNQVLNALVKQGIGFDVVSGGEMNLALGAQVDPVKVVFSGVGKSREELHQAVQLEIGQINVESLPELVRLGEVAQSLGRSVRIGLRFNPDLDAGTHPYITTGLKENKFGIDVEQFAEFREILQRYAEYLHFQGLAFHLGSQIMNPEVVWQAVERARGHFEEFRRLGYPLKSLDVGGGLGLDYQGESWTAEVARLRDYAQGIENALQGLDCELHAEPGRFLVARAGALCGQVEYVKKGSHRSFIVLNTGMNHLLRPALYQAVHRVCAVAPSSGSQMEADVVGPICESSDVFARGWRGAEPESGDWFAVLDAGAYGFVMANTYNARALPEEVVVSGGKILEVPK